MNELMSASLDDLALFVHVVEAGGFTASARHTGTPQGTISRRIASLEDGLGLKLLNRTTRRVELTEPGRRVFDHARQMLDHAEAATRLVEEMQGEPAGDLRVTAPIVLGQAFVSDILAVFMSRYPKVRVVVEWTTRSVHPIEDGIDVALSVGRQPDSGLALTQLGTTRVGIFASPDFDAGVIAQPADLADHAVFVLGVALDDTATTFQKGGAIETVILARRMASNDVNPIIAAARASAGLAILPKFAAPPGWTRLLADWDMPPIEINAVSATTRGALPRVRALLATLSDEMRARANA